MAAKEEVDEEEDFLLQLFDLYWFKCQILTNQTPFQKGSPKPKLSQETSVLVMRSFSDQSLSSKDLINHGGLHSPNSVLAVSTLETLVSGKEPDYYSFEKAELQGKENRSRKGRRSRRSNGISKSLSELEFEELKGFMDLGFVFSEEDKESPRLVSILPGLQRRGGKKGNGDGYVAIDGEEQEAARKAVSRPYLSEAWEELDSSREEEEEKQPLMIMMKNWRLPSLSNEVDMKNHLRTWAHAVASAVR